jgi:asparagine synthase (glutamine-hydrolysing)
MRLPAAHSITVTADRVRIARYWQIDTAADARHGTDADYAEHFVDLFGKAVSCRLRCGDGSPAAYLSGGLDSSSVVGMARSLGASVDTYSLVFPHDPLADERPYIEDVARRWNVPSHCIVPPALDGNVCRAHVARRRDTLDLPADLASECLMARMRERGARVVLTGVGGDYCFSGSLLHYADLLQRGDVIGFLRQVWADRSVADAGWSIWQPFLSGVRPLIPARWRRAVRPVAKRLGWIPALPDWIEPSFASRVALADRLRPPTWPEGAPTFARRQVCELFASGWPYLLLEAGERSAAEYGLEERHPFFDRRLIEFGVSLPETQRWRGQQTKYLLRRAMAGVLPESVRERNGKGDFRATVAQGVEAIGGAALFDRLSIASRGWVDEKRAQALYGRSQALFAADHEDYCDGMFKLWMIGGIELWYGMTCVEGRVHESQDRTLEPEWTARQPAGPEAPAALPSSRTH